MSRGLPSSVEPERRAYADTCDYVDEDHARCHDSAAVTLPDALALILIGVLLLLGVRHVVLHAAGAETHR